MTPGELGLWLTLGAVVLLTTVSALLPLRGGHGQHAHAGPGTLTVAQISQGERTVLALAPPKRSVHPPNNTPGEAGIAWPTARDNHWLSPRHPSLVEEDLTELLPAGTGYVGRHRLDEPRAAHEIPPGTRLRAA